MNIKIQKYTLHRVKLNSPSSTVFVVYVLYNSYKEYVNLFRTKTNTCVCYRLGGVAIIFFRRHFLRRINTNLEQKQVPLKRFSTLTECLRDMRVRAYRVRTIFTRQVPSCFIENLRILYTSVHLMKSDINSAEFYGR